MQHIRADWEVNHNEQKDWEVAQYWAKSNEQPTSAGASWRGGIVQQWGTATISLDLSVLHLAASYWCGKSLLKQFFYYELFILPGKFFCCHNWLENEKKHHWNFRCGFGELPRSCSGNQERPGGWPPTPSSRAQTQLPTDKGLSSSISTVPSKSQLEDFIRCLLQQLVINDQYWWFICTGCA